MQDRPRIKTLLFLVGVLTASWSGGASAQVAPGQPGTKPQPAAPTVSPPGDAASAQGAAPDAAAATDAAPQTAPAGPAPAAPAAEPADPARRAETPEQRQQTPGAQPTLIPPVLEQFVDAEYPVQAQTAGLEAAVKLTIQVSETGEVAGVEVSEPVGQGFDEAAVAAARQFRFRPATFGGKPVPVTIRFTYRFELRQEQRTVTPAAARQTAETDAQPSPPVTVEGRVLRRGDRVPLGNLGVVVEGHEELSAQTAPDGSFELALPPGTWKLRVVHPEYEDYLTEEQVRVPGTFGEPFRVVQSLPGVARSPFGTGFMVVRGAAPEDTGFYFNGHMLPDLYHFFSGPALINADLVDQIDFYPGNYPVDHGRRQAGIITTSLKDRDRPDRIGGNLSLDLLDVEALTYIPLGEDTTLTVAGRRSHFDLLIPVITEEAVRPRYWDYQVLGSSRWGDWRANLMALGGYDGFDYETEPDSVDDPGTSMKLLMDRIFHQVQGTLSGPLPGGGKLTISPSATYAVMSVDADGTAMEMAYQTYVLRSNAQLPLLKDRLELKLGGQFDAVRTSLQTDVPGMPAFTDFPAPVLRWEDDEAPRNEMEIAQWGYGPSLWAAVEWKVGPLLLIPGLRMDYMTYDAFDDLTFDPRLVARWQVNEQLTFKGGVGLFHQEPLGQAMDSTWGSPETLKTPYSFQKSFGVEVEPLDFLEIDATAYHNSYHDLIMMGSYSSEGGRTSGGPAYNNDGSGRSYGLELLVRHRPQGDFFGWVSYTLARSERKDPDHDWYLYGMDQTHILSAVASYRFAKHWTAGMKFQLVSGMPRTPVVGSVYDVDTDTWQPKLGAAMSKRNPTFHQLDIRIDREFLFDRWKMTAYLDLMNAYYQKNTEFETYSYDYSESSPITGLPILPSLGIKGEF